MALVAKGFYPTLDTMNLQLATFGMIDSKIFEGPNFLGWLQGQWKTLSLDTIDFILFCEIFVLYYWCLLFILISDPPVGTPSFYLAQYLKHHVLQSILRHWKHGVRWKGTPLFSSTGLAFAFSSFSRGKGSTAVPWAQSNMHRSIHPFFGCIA